MNLKLAVHKSMAKVMWDRLQSQKAVLQHIRGDMIHSIADEISRNFEMKEIKSGRDVFSFDDSFFSAEVVEIRSEPLYLFDAEGLAEHDERVIEEYQKSLRWNNDRVE